jgi:hypothetical protein
MPVLAPIEKPMPPSGNCWKVGELQKGVALLMRLVSPSMVTSLQPTQMPTRATKCQVGRTNPLADPLRARVALPADKMAVRSATLAEAVKVTWTVQVALGANVWEAQVPPVISKCDVCGPEIIRSGTTPPKVPVLRRVKVWVAVVAGATIVKIPDGESSKAQVAAKPLADPVRAWEAVPLASVPVAEVTLLV